MNPSIKSFNHAHYTYHVIWSPEDNEHVGLCVEFPSLSWLAAIPEKALAGIRQVIACTIADMQVNSEQVPNLRQQPDLKTKAVGLD